MLQDKELAILATQTEAPLIIADILSGREKLTGSVKYTLHDLLSDMQPDSALLAIALSARKLANLYSRVSPGIRVLGMECDRVIEEFGETWLQNANGEHTDDDEVMDLLENTAEDLESIAELLELNAPLLHLKSLEAAELFDILQIQASAHAMIAEEFVKVMDEQEINVPKNTASEITTDNIVSFPR